MLLIQVKDAKHRSYKTSQKIFEYLKWRDRSHITGAIQRRGRNPVMLEFELIQYRWEIFAIMEIG